MMVLAVADRCDESVDEHTVPAGLFEALIDFGAGDRAQDRLQDFEIASDGGVGTAEHLAEDPVVLNRRQVQGPVRR